MANPPSLPPRRNEDKSLPPLHPKPKPSISSFFPRDPDADEQAISAQPLQEPPLSILQRVPATRDPLPHPLPLTREALPLATDVPPIPPKSTPALTKHSSSEHSLSGSYNGRSSQFISPSSGEAHSASTLPHPKADTSTQSLRQKSRQRYSSLPVYETRPCEDSIAENNARASVGPVELPPDKGTPFSIDKFTTSYVHLLPTRVRVEQGYFDFERNFGVTTGEVYNMHFIKKIKSMSMLDSLSQRHVLPINASVEYCLLHNPEGDPERARAGYTYRTAGDIMSLQTLPVVVRAKSSYRGGDASSSVEEFETFIVLQVTKKHKFMRSRILSVYSVTNCMKKVLSEECEGNFSTDPYGTKLFLPEILQHIPNPFPASALMFVNPDVTHNIPLHLFDELLSLEGLVESRSVIATLCDLRKQSSPSTSSLSVGSLIEFPVSLPITVTLLDEEEEEGYSEDSSFTSSSLVNHTRNIIDGFDPSKVSTCAISVEARKGHELLGLEVEVPHYQSLSSIKESLVEKAKECGTYTLITQEMIAPVHMTQGEGNPGGWVRRPVVVGDKCSVGRARSVEEQSRSVASGGIASAVMGPTESERIRALEQQMEDVKRTTTTLQQGLQGVQVSMEASLVRVEKQLLQMSMQLQKLEWMTGGSMDKKFQLTPSLLSVDQVGELLDTLGLQQYKAIFKEEEIDGEVFVNLTNEILECNLCINSPQERMKLMKVIQGRCAIPVYLVPINNK